VRARPNIPTGTHSPGQITRTEQPTKAQYRSPRQLSLSRPLPCSSATKRSGEGKRRSSMEPGSPLDPAPANWIRRYLAPVRACLGRVLPELGRPGTAMRRWPPRRIRSTSWGTRSRTRWAHRAPSFDPSAVSCAACIVSRLFVSISIILACVGVAARHGTRCREQRISSLRGAVLGLLFGRESLIRVLICRFWKGDAKSGSFSLVHLCSYLVTTIDRSQKKLRLWSVELHFLLSHVFVLMCPSLFRC
jgi:hypothetical protein